MVNKLLRENYDLKKLIEQYRYDQLTGLLGLVDFNKDLDNLPLLSSWILVMVDIDDLHNVNIESYEAGNEVIKKVANELKKKFVDDKIYRTKGDEFYVLTQKVYNNLEIYHSTCSQSPINKNNIKEVMNKLDQDIIFKKGKHIHQKRKTGLKRVN